jgi:diadenosine tetraphosphate (Ap4A) HIT family hydrolase
MVRGVVVVESSGSCPFCAKLARLAELPADEVVWQFPHSVALLGHWQYFTGYCVLVSRTHATELSHLPAVVRREFLDEMCRLARAIELEFAPTKLNYELLGNQVRHLHWHLFPRWSDDPDARRPVWFALDRAESDPAERERLQTGPQPSGEIAARLRRRLRLLADGES